MGTSSTNRSTPVAVATAVLAALLLLCWASDRAAAETAPAPYEPNDSSAAAYGPLGSGQVLTAGLESSTDRDFFYFYVTSAEAPISLSVHSLGGNSRSASGINATLLNLEGSPQASLYFIRDGELRSATASLKPQKYFVEVAPSEGSGDSYELSVAGPPGAVGPFSQITAQCVAAEESVRRSRSALGGAEAKLQRVVARLQRSRYSGPKARSSARAAARKAHAVLRKKRTMLREAKAEREPWCSIAP